MVSRSLRPGRDAFPNAPRIHAEGPGYQVASWTNILLIIVSAEVSSELLQASVAAHHLIHARYPSGIGVLTLVEGTPPIPSPDVRLLASQHIRSTAGEVLAQASLFEAGGFWASTLRSAMTTINLLARAPNPTKVFGARAEAIAWLGQYMEIGDDGGWMQGFAAVVNGALASVPEAPLRTA